VKNIRKKSWLFVLLVVVVLAVIGGGALVTAGHPETWVVFDPGYQLITTRDEKGTQYTDWACVSIGDRIGGRLQTVTDLLGIEYESLYSDDPYRGTLSVRGEIVALIVVGQTYNGDTYAVACVPQADGNEPQYWGSAIVIGDELFVDSITISAIVRAIGFPSKDVIDGVWYVRTGR